MARSLLLALYFAGLLAGQTTPTINWNSRIASDAPLTANARWKVAAHNSFASPAPYFQALGSALGQTFGNSPKEWGRTGGGFGRRVGLGFLTNSSQALVHSGSSALLGFDPRYQRCDCKGGWRRMGHAFSGIVLSADSEGKRHFNPSNLLSSYASGYIGATVYPDRYTVLNKGTQLGHQQVGGVAFQNLIEEFKPELKRFFLHTLLRRP